MRIMTAALITKLEESTTVSGTQVTTNVVFNSDKPPNSNPWYGTTLGHCVAPTCQLLPDQG